VSSDGEFVVVGDTAFQDPFLGLWQGVEEVNGRAAALGSFLLGAFDGHVEAERFAWNGYEVVRRRLGPGPESLARRAPAVGSWDAYLVYAGEKPVAMALGPSGGGTAWISVVFDDVVSAIEGWFEEFEEWRIVKRPEAT
jgi:hypothetical protein